MTKMDSSEHIKRERGFVKIKPGSVRPGRAVGEIVLEFSAQNPSCKPIEAKYTNYSSEKLERVSDVFRRCALGGGVCTVQGYFADIEIKQEKSSNGRGKKEGASEIRRVFIVESVEDGISDPRVRRLEWGEVLTDAARARQKKNEEYSTGLGRG